MYAICTHELVQKPLCFKPPALPRSKAYLIWPKQLLGPLKGAFTLMYCLEAPPI